MVAILSKSEKATVADFYSSIHYASVIERVNRNHNGILDKEELKQLSKIYTLKLIDYGGR